MAPKNPGEKSGKLLEDKKKPEMKPTPSTSSGKAEKPKAEKKEPDKKQPAPAPAAATAKLTKTPPPKEDKKAVEAKSKKGQPESKGAAKRPAEESSKSKKKSLQKPLSNMADDSDVVPKRLYDELLAKIEAKDYKIGELQCKSQEILKDLANVKDKYNELKGAEIVRSEIETYERLWITNFIEDETKYDGLYGIAISREMRRQKWYHILMNSTNRDVHFLRTLILLDELEVKYLKLFNVDNYESIKKLSGYFKCKELNRLKIEHLKTNHQEDTFIEALINYLCKETFDDAKFSEWYNAQFENFARCVSEIYSCICDKIHNARFVDGDEIPQEYNILKKPEYNRCINHLMSFYE